MGRGQRAVRRRHRATAHAFRSRPVRRRLGLHRRGLRRRVGSGGIGLPAGLAAGRHEAAADGAFAGCAAALRGHGRRIARPADAGTPLPRAGDPRVDRPGRGHGPWHLPRDPRPWRLGARRAADGGLGDRRDGLDRHVEMAAARRLPLGRHSGFAANRTAPDRQHAGSDRPLPPVRIADRRHRGRLRSGPYPHGLPPRRHRARHRVHRALASVSSGPVAPATRPRRAAGPGGPAVEAFQRGDVAVVRGTCGGPGAAGGIGPRA